MNNSRFATSLHILTLLYFQQDELLSSEYIAGSININPSIVRKEISNLKEHGLLTCKEGKGGGSTLSKSAQEIKLSDIYQAVRQSSLLGRSNDPNPKCKVGKQINFHIDKLYTQAEEAMIKKLAHITLADFSKEFK